MARHPVEAPESTGMSWALVALVLGMYGGSGFRVPGL